MALSYKYQVHNKYSIVLGKRFLYCYFLNLNNTLKVLHFPGDSDPQNTLQVGGRRVEIYINRVYIFLIILAGPSRDL